MLNYIRKNYALRGYPLSIQAAKSAVLSYSQFGEDLLLQNYLGFLARDVNYLDIGAYHPIKFSNTYLSYLKGGRGIAVEPNPQFRDAWGKYRRRDELLSVAVSPSVDGSVHYHSHSATPSLNYVSNQPCHEAGFVSEKIECVSISSLVNFYCDRFPKLDALSIDCEGLDYEILKAFPLSKVRPKAIIVEDFHLGSESPIDCFMNEQKYDKWAQLRISKIFVDSVLGIKP